VRLDYVEGPPRRYVLGGDGDGPAATIPSVTDIIGRFFPHYAGGNNSTFGRELGSDIHRAIELDEAGVLDVDSLDDFVLPRWDAYTAWREANSEWYTYGVEEMVCHPTLRYAGRIDLVLRDHDHIMVVDLKSGGPEKHHRLQTAAYRNALLEWADLMTARTVRRGCLYLPRNGEAKLVEHHDHELDFRAFAQLRDVYQWTERTNQ
jgi:hypothetical protein